MRYQHEVSTEHRTNSRLDSRIHISRGKQRAFIHEGLSMSCNNCSQQHKRSKEHHIAQRGRASCTKFPTGRCCRATQALWSLAGTSTGFEPLTEGSLATADFHCIRSGLGLATDTGTLLRKVPAQQRTADHRREACLEVTMFSVGEMSGVGTCS